MAWVTVVKGAVVAQQGVLGRVVAVDGVESG